MHSAQGSDILPNSTSPNGAAHKPGAQIQAVVDSIYEKYKNVDEGQVATYIPELAKADPSHFGICIATVDGHVFRAGDYDEEFTMQSMCKPLAFQMALEEHGQEETSKHVGIEPSGDAFNSIELDARTSRPYNPMINAGAIAISSLIRKTPVEVGIQAFVDRMSEAAARPLRIDDRVMHSETLTGNRNRAIAYLMCNFGIIDEHVNESLQQYFAQCSLLVTCQDMAIMAATLANRGINTVADAVRETGANASVIYVPPAFAADARQNSDRQ